MNLCHILHSPLTRIPPPLPTSKIFTPSNTLILLILFASTAPVETRPSRIRGTRRVLNECNGFIGPLGSHQSSESFEKCSTSAELTFCAVDDDDDEYLKLIKNFIHCKEFQID